jgi:RND family efflux transporter MFP subunit
VVPTPGETVAADQTVFHLSPLLAPEREVPSAAERIAMANARASLLSSQITAKGDENQAAAQVEAARIALARAQRLLQDKVGSQRDVDDAQARLDVATEAWEAANAREDQLDKLSFDAVTAEVNDVIVQSPQDGMLRNVSSSVGQIVSAGAPLFEVVCLERMWVRVPVYPGLRGEVDHNQPAVLRKLGQHEEFVVQPANVPPSADFLATTVDLFYELPNTEGRFLPGEPVEIVLPLAGDTESLVVPRASILRDIHGIAWVYVNSAENEYRRQRVEVHFTTDELAILSAGPVVGTQVVVDGAAELFGTEFGAGK